MLLKMIFYRLINIRTNLHCIADITVRGNAQGSRNIRDEHNVQYCSFMMYNNMTMLKSCQVNLARRMACG